MDQVTLTILVMGVMLAILIFIIMSVFLHIPIASVLLIIIEIGKKFL